jgi:hypothetical protein
LAVASHEWLAIYRTYTSAELAAEIEELKRETKNKFQSQTVGGKSYTRATAEIRDRLHAATKVLAQSARAALTPMERGDIGVPDFSKVRI